MNKREKEIQQAYLNNEKAVLKKLEGNYKDALGEINSKIEILMARQDADMQHVIYQVEYQKALKTQVQAILETLQANEFETLSEYLTKSYEDGFIGTMYNLQGQGIPLVFPIDQEQVLAAIQHETKLSEPLYTALGKDVVDLRKKIAGEISRGISSGQMYGEIARNIAGYAMIPKNNAMRIARTEAHRIQCKASMNACNKAKEKGADVVKQWDSSLDGNTRPTHRQLDGQIRELDEPFEVAGKSAMQPGDFGDPAEDCNCRCALLQRARWALGNDYTKWSPDAPVVIDDDGTTQFTIIEAKNYEDFQKKYKQASERVREDVQKMNESKTPLLSHDVAEIDYRAEKVTFKDLQEWKKSIGNVTDDEYSIIDGMSDTGYIKSSNSYKINKAMREGTVHELSEGNQKTIETLKNVINKNVSDVDAVLIRKVDRNYLESVYNIKSTELKDIVDEINTKKIGETYIEKGFVSTSYKADKNINLNDDIELDIYAPKGTNMFLTKNRTESEIILQTNTRFELEGAVLTDDGKVRLLMKVVPDDVVEETLENIGKSSKIVNTKTALKSQYKITPAMNEYDYFDEKQELFRKNSIKELAGYSDEQAQKTIEALCGTREQYLQEGYFADNRKLGWFYGQDRDIRTLANEEAIQKAKIIDQYIKDAPNYEGTIYRGFTLSEEDIDMLKSSKKYVDKGSISSWTSDSSVADEFAMGRSEQFDKKPVVFKCSNVKDCTPASHLSIYGIDEAEVLVSNFDHKDYTVVSVTEENGITIFEVSED